MNTDGGHCYTTICRTVVHADCIAIRRKSNTTRKDNFIYISMPFVWFFRSKHPFVTALQATIGFIQIKQSEPQSVNNSGPILLHAVIDHEPTLYGFNRRGGESDLISVPPAAKPCFQNFFMITPVPQVQRVRYPHVRTCSSDRAVDQCPVAIDPARQQSSVFIFWLHDSTIAFECMEIFRKSQGYTWSSAGVGRVCDGILTQFRDVGNARSFDAPQFLWVVFRISHQCRLGIDLPMIHTIHRTGSTQVGLPVSSLDTA